MKSKIKTKIEKKEITAQADVMIKINKDKNQEENNQLILMIEIKLIKEEIDVNKNIQETINLKKKTSQPILRSL